MTEKTSYKYHPTLDIWVNTQKYITETNRTYKDSKGEIYYSGT